MVWQLTAYAMVVAAALGMAALCGERLAMLRGWPRRMIWASAIAASLVGPVVAVLMVEPEVAMPGIGVEASPAGGAVVAPSMDSEATRPAAADIAGSIQSSSGVSMPAGAAVTAQRGPDDAQPVAAARPAARGAAAQLLRWLPGVSVPAMLVTWLLVSTALWLHLLGAAVLLQRRAAAWRRARVLGHEVLVSPDAGPALFGAWRPRIVVPQWFPGLPAGQQALILAHELQHLAARDALLLRVAQLAVAAMPWNLPLWWQLRRLRLAIEVDCDARVLRAGADAVGYGQMLLGVAQRAGAAPFGAVAMSRPRSVLEYRIRHLAARPVRRAALQAGAAGLLAAVGMAAVVALEVPALPTRVLPVPVPMAAAAGGPLDPQQAAASAGQSVPGATTMPGDAPAAPGASSLPEPARRDALPATGGNDGSPASPPPGPVAVDLPALPTPLDPGNAVAVANRAVEALVAAHPQLVDGTPRGGWYSGAVVLRADGSVLRAVLRHAPDRAQAIRDILDLRYLPTSTLVRPALRLPGFQPGQIPIEARRPGDLVGDGKVLRDNVIFQYAVLPPGTDERRMLLVVWEAVLARHDALLLPRDASVANRLTVLLTDDGRIERERVEVGPRERMLAGSPDFGALGLRPEEIGQWGTTTLTRNDYSDAEAAPADQQVIRAALASALQVRDELIVHYAWSRREGEPADGSALRSAGQPAGLRAIALELIDPQRAVQD